MPRSTAQAPVVDRAVRALPGWMLLGAGLALVAAVVLTPAWLDYRQLAWQHEVIAAQTEHLAEQAERYDRFHLALVEDDPIVLERLAYVELGLKPVGKTPLPPGPAPDATPPGLHHFAAHRPANVQRAPRPGPSPTLAAGSIDDWLTRPLPRVGGELPAYQPPRTRLTRLATGHSRFALLAAGLACLAAGLWPGMWGNGEAEGENVGERRE